MDCYDEGVLRAYIDDVLPINEYDQVAAHIADCPICSMHVDEQRQVMRQVAALLAAPAPAPDPQHALERLLAHQGARPTIAGLSSTPGEPSPRPDIRYQPRRTLMRTSALWSGPRRGIFAGLAALIVMVSLLAIPPVRAAADQLLQIFRMQKIVFVQVDPARIEQLQQLNFNTESLFVGKPQGLDENEKPKQVDTLAKASEEVGFSVAAPQRFPSQPSATELYVMDHKTVSFQINIDSARQLLELTGVDDVTLPDTLGTQKIRADIEPMAMSKYSGEGYTLALIESQSPSVTLPDGVDMAQLGYAGLRVLGMAPDEAATMSKQIDWTSTLVVPMPKDLSNIREIQVRGAPATLVGSANDNGYMSLYWQKGDHLMVLQTTGTISQSELIAIAESVD